MSISGTGESMQVIRTQEGSETWDNDGNVSECEIKYYVISPTSKASAIKAVLDASPLIYDNADGSEEVPVTDLSSSDDEDDAEEETNDCVRTGVRFDGYDEGGNMEISVLYSASAGGEDIPDSDGNYPSVSSFDCSGGSKHITHAISQRKAYSSSSSSTSSSGDDTGGAIGWNGKTGHEMEIAGCDIPTGQIRESYSKIFKMSAITTKMKKDWVSMVGKVNNDVFKGWAAGEVMFLGCSYTGNAKGSTKITVQFNFAVQLNETKAFVHGVDCGLKNGFDVIWAMSETEKGSNDEPVTKIKGIYIAKVCETANFGTLGI